MASPPSVSIVIPTHDRPELVQLAVRSALVALPGGIGEVIVSDDHGARPAAQALADLDHPALRVVLNGGPRGAAGNRTHGALLAQGDLLIFLDDDDLMSPDYPAAVQAAAAADPQAAWGFSGMAYHQPDVTAWAGDGPITPPRAHPRRALHRQLAGLGCGFWIRRAVFADLGGIDPDLTVNEDTELCLRLVAAGHLPRITPAHGVSLLRSTGGLTRSTPPSERMRCFRMILDRHAGLLARNPRGHVHLLRRYMKVAAKARAPRPCLRAALREGPWYARPASLAYALGNLLAYRLRG